MTQATQKTQAELQAELATLNAELAALKETAKAQVLAMMKENGISMKELRDAMPKKARKPKAVKAAPATATA